MRSATTTLPTTRLCLCLLTLLAAGAAASNDVPRPRPAHHRPLLVATLPETATTAGDIAAPPPPPPKASILRKAARKAIGGGLSGWLAGIVQVLFLMWLRTTMNYQYRYGASTLTAIRTLYAQGGVPRFYRGIGWALLQTPLSRFGDAAANSGVLELLSTSPLPMSLRTAIAGLTASLWRVMLTPLDTLKTTLQVEGSGAYDLLIEKVTKHGIGELYAGSLATLAASFIGSYPWFVTFNYLDAHLPKIDPSGPLRAKASRSALLGVSATCVSDTIANSLRVIKTTKQTSAEALSYLQAARMVIAKDGWAGLLLRGLTTRLITNAIQASVFTIVWKLVEERLNTRDAQREAQAEEAATAARATTAAIDVPQAEAPPELDPEEEEEEQEEGGVAEDERE